MKARPARRLTLTPSTRLDEASATAASAALATEAREVSLRLGDVVRAAGHALVVTAADPVGAVRLAPQTEVRLDLNGHAEAPEADRWDVVVAVDHSYSMRAHLPMVRRGITSLLLSAGDVIQRVALVGFSRESFRLAPLGPPDPVRASALAASPARGRGRLVDGVDFALAELLGASDGGRRAIILVTDGSEDGDAVADAATRARRLDVTLHAWDVAATPSPDLQAAVRATGGVAADRRASLRPVLDHLAAKAGVPATWQEAPADGEVVEFEVVVAAVPETTSRFPPIPRRRRSDRDATGPGR